MKKTSILLFILLLGFMFMPNVVKADTQEIEPNNSKSEAQLINLNETCTGTTDRNNTDNYIDYYKIELTEGRFYKITIQGSEEYKEDWWDFDAYLTYDGDTNDNESIKNSLDTDLTIQRLVQPKYTGYHYIEIGCLRNSEYTLKIEKFDTFGIKVKDKDTNVYMITGNDTVEFSKAASKSVSDYILEYSVDFSYIDSIRLLNTAYFTITSIGENAFEECNFKNLTIPDNIYYINSNAFKNCKKLETVWIEGKNVTLDNNTFYNCSKLRVLGLEKGASLEYVGTNALKGTKKGIKIFTPNKKKYQKMFKKSGAKKPKYKKS